MTDKFDKFRAAIEALCIEHNCQLAPSRYDELTVWNLREGEDPLHGGLIDETGRDILPP